MSIDDFKKTAIPTETSGAAAIEFYRVLKIVQKAFDRNSDASKIKHDLQLASPGIINRGVADFERIFEQEGIDLKQIT